MDKIISLLIKRYKNINNNNLVSFTKMDISSYYILILNNKNLNNVFIGIFDSNLKTQLAKLFLLHLTQSYQNILTKLDRNLDDRENTFPVIYTQIFLPPFLHNLNNNLKSLSKKIDLLLFGNAEYSTTFFIDLESGEILYDLNENLLNCKLEDIIFLKNNPPILNEIIFHGKILRKRYFNLKDKNVEQSFKTIKIEFRATFPRLLFYIKFLPIFDGAIIVHMFTQYKLSKTQVLNSNHFYVYDSYKEIDVAYNVIDNNASEIEDLDLEQIRNLQDFFLEYFLLLEKNNNISKSKAKNKNKNINVNSQIDSQFSTSIYSNPTVTSPLTYKNKDYNLKYLDNGIIMLISDVVKEYFKDITDLLYKIKKKLKDENTKLKNNNLIEDTTSTRFPTSTLRGINSNYNRNCNNIYLEKEKNLSEPLEFGYVSFIKEFQNLETENQNNDSLNVGDINILMKNDYSNINEYSELNFTRDNLNMLKRKFSNNCNDNDINNNFNEKKTNENKNIYENYNSEYDGEIFSNNTNAIEPFNIDVTNIIKNPEISKDEWVIKSIFGDKSKSKINNK